MKDLKSQFEETARLANTEGYTELTMFAFSNARYFKKLFGYKDEGEQGAELTAVELKDFMQIIMEAQFKAKSIPEVDALGKIFKKAQYAYFEVATEKEFDDHIDWLKMISTSFDKNTHE